MVTGPTNDDSADVQTTSPTRGDGGILTTRTKTADGGVSEQDKANRQIRKQRRRANHFSVVPFEGPPQQHFASLPHHCNVATALPLFPVSTPSPESLIFDSDSSSAVLRHDRVTVLRFGPFGPGWAVRLESFGVCPEQVGS
jgi:hypothetical protein